jgi:hypothetical protein
MATSRRSFMDCRRQCDPGFKISNAVGLCPRPNARDQDVDKLFGGPLTIGSQACVRDTGKRAQQVERIKVQANVAARDRVIDQPRNCLLHLRRRR